MLISIITPVYNSESFLFDLYSNLKNIYTKFDNFEWIMVDDLSEDNSRMIMSKIVESSPPFPIKTIYLSRNYYGSMSTYSAAQIAEGEYSIILDADDLLIEDALITYSSLIRKYQSKPNFVGVCGRCEDFSGHFLGTPFKFEEIYSNELYIRHVLGIKGEMLQCTKTELIKKYFLGALPGFANGWVWSRMSQNYSWIYTNKIVRKYNTQNYNSTSHFYHVRYLNNKVIAAIDYLSVMRKFFFSDPIYWMKKALMVAIASWLCKKVYMGKNQHWSIQLVLILLIPLGAFLALAAIIIYGRKKFMIHE